MKSKKNFGRALTLVVTMILMSAFIIVGCTNQKPDGTTPTPAPNETTNPPATTPNGEMIEGTFDQKKVTALEEAIEEFPEVENAYVVLSSNSAWIALDLKTDGIINNGATNGTATTPGNATSNTTPNTTSNTTTPGTTTGGTTPNTTGTAADNIIPEELRTKVENTTKSMYSEITSVYVTADPDFVDRLQQIGKDLATGKPIKEFTNDLREIGDAIMKPMK